MTVGRHKHTYLLEQYKKWLKTLGFSSHTVYNYPQMLNLFFEYLDTQGVSQIYQLTQNHVKNYFDYLQTRPNMRTGSKTLSVAHLNKSFDAVDKFLEFLQQIGSKNTTSPTNYRILETKSEQVQKVKAFKKDDINTLYATAQKLFPRLPFGEAEPRRALATLILDLCYGCGLRKSEAYKLLIEDIDFDKKLLFIKQAKGYKDRYIPMSETVTQRIKLFIYQYRSSFKATHKRAFPLSLHSLAYYSKILLQNSGLKYSTGIGLHTLRHSIATHLLQNGMSIEQIAKFLGHNSLESTQIYTHLSNEYEKQ
jgi:integrase/recombinase XerD